MSRADPSADLESPEQKAITATAAADIWTPAQMGTFLDHTAAHRLSGCFALTLLGLRREEVGGLRWCDIDLESGAMRIRQARVDLNGRDTIVGTKTERSARDLPLPPRELAMLKAMRGTPARAPGRGPTAGRHQTAALAARWDAAAGARSPSASSGTPTSRVCARRVWPLMWSPPGTATPSA
jgi:integrase